VLGCGAHVTKLHRNAVAGFTDDDSIALDELVALREDKQGEELDYLLKPADRAVDHLLTVELDSTTAWYFRRGQPVTAQEAYRDAEEGDIVRIFEDGGLFLGIGEVLEDGRLAPRRLVVE
jgi:tRNA pseudouridine55 synthase